MSDIVFHSKIGAAEAEKEKNVILREIDMYLDDPDSQLMQMVFKTAFRTHPYRYPVIGERALYAELSADDMQQYYKGRYAPNNTVLIISGDVNFDHARELIEQCMKDCSIRRLLPAYIPDETEQLGIRHEYRKEDYQVTRGALTFKVPGLRHEDSLGLDILARVLGAGQSSRLWSNIRDEQQLVHHISASTWNPGSSGLFWINYLCDNGKEKDVEEAIWRELEKIQNEGISNEELEKTVRQIAVSEVNSRKTVSGNAGRLGLFEVVVGDLSYPDYYLENLTKITAESISPLAQNYFKQKGLSAILLAGGGGKKQSAVSATQKTPLPDFEERTLSNGIRILLQPVDGLPKINIRTLSLGGPLYETVDTRGMSALTATMLARDTEKRNAQEVALEIETLGGGFAEYAGNNSIGLSLEMLSDDIEQGIDILADGLLHPVFTDHTFEVEREGQMAQIRESLDDVVEYGCMQLRKTFFGEHPFCYDCYGELESLEKATPATARKFYKQLITPDNLILAVSGAFEADTMHALLEKALGSFSGDGFVKQKCALDKPAKTGIVEENVDREQTVVFVAFPDVGVTHPDFYTGELLDEIYSGMSSGLFDLVREKEGMAYFVTASRLVGLETGMFYFYAGTTHEHHQSVINAIHSEIKRVQEGKIDEAELARCKTRLKAAKQLSLQTASSRCMQAVLNAAFGEPINDWKNYNARIDAVTVEMLQVFAGRFTDDRSLTMVFTPGA